jgi:maltose alpha-D-glucosyltransferase/alpha-amylase
MAAETDPSWYEDAVFYELFVRAFADANGDGIGDLAGLSGRLAYLKRLGVDAVWLLPIMPSPLRDDGYDVADYCAIHPDYGTLDDFSDLVAEAHRLGLKVVVEMIPNHTSDQHPWFRASRDPEHPEHARYRDWYVWSDTGTEYGRTRIIFTDTEPSNWTFDPLRGQYFWHRFFSHQPDLNYDNPEVQRAMLRAVQFWLDLGVDAFRVDATPYLVEREGTSCENLPETHAFLKRLRGFVDAYAPGTMLLSEANMWPEEVRPYFGGDPADPGVAGDEFHMNFHFPLMPRIFMALARADRAPILEVLARTPPIPAGCQWATFLRCHDELTLEMVTPEEREFMWDYYAPEPRMRLNLGIRRRLAPLLENDRERIELAWSLLMTLPGAPVIYYGDEIGMGDNIWLDDRDGVRTPMQWDAGANGGFSLAPSRVLYCATITDPVFGYARVNVAAQEDDPGSLLNRVQRLVAARKAQPALCRGTVRFLQAEPGALLAIVREHAGAVVAALHNLGAQPLEFALDLPGLAASSPVDLLSGERLEPVGEAPYRLSLPARGYRWLRLA